MQAFMGPVFLVDLAINLYLSTYWMLIFAANHHVERLADAWRVLEVAGDEGRHIVICRNLTVFPPHIKRLAGIIISNRIQDASWKPESIQGFGRPCCTIIAIVNKPHLR